MKYFPNDANHALFSKKVIGKRARMWYHGQEVNPMEQENDLTNEQQSVPEQEQYKPRPAWQVWAARIGLVLFVIFVLLYHLNICGVTI